MLTVGDSRRAEFVSEDGVDAQGPFNGAGRLDLSDPALAALGLCCIFDHREGDGLRVEAGAGGYCMGNAAWL